MKQCKCKVCGNIQDYKLLNCQKCGEEMPKVVLKSFQPKNTAKKPSVESPKPRKQLSASRLILAIIVCAAIVFAYAIIGAILGWKHGGGILPMLILFATISFAWKKITSKKQEKIDNKKSPTKSNNSKKKWFFGGFILAIIFVILSAMIFYGYKTQKGIPEYQKAQKANNSNIAAFGFTKYNLSEDNLAVYFPQAPEKQEVEVNIEGLKKIRYYTASSNSEPVKYIVMAAILDGKILSQDSIDAWLKNLLESRIANHKNPEIKDDQYVQFKGMKSRLYSYTFENESENINRNKIIAFIYNGKPFELEIIYPADYNGNLYWDEFIESIELY